VESLQNVCQMLVQSACHGKFWFYLIKWKWKLILARIKRDDILVLLFCVIPCSPISIGEINVPSKSASCSSSDSSLSCILIDQDEKQEKEEEEEEESFDLFIFEDSN
jgi:hypothetical protein